MITNYRELKALAKRADRARGEGRKQSVEKLIRELPKLDPFERKEVDTQTATKPHIRAKEVVRTWRVPKESLERVSDIIG